MTLMLHIVVGCTYLWIHKYIYLYLSPTTSAAARVNINERRRLTNHSQLIYLLLPAIGNEATGISRRRRIRWRSTRHAGAQKTPHPIRGDKKASYRFWTLFLPLLTRAHKTIENPSATFFFFFRIPSVVLVAVLLPFAESLSSCAESPKLSTAVFVPVLPTDRPPSISSYRMAKQGVSVFIASMGTRELSNGEAHFKRSNNRNCNSSPPPTDQWLSGGSRSASVPSTKPSNNCYSGTQPPPPPLNLVVFPWIVLDSCSPLLLRLLVQDLELRGSENFVNYDSQRCSSSSTWRGRTRRVGGGDEK